MTGGCRRLADGFQGEPRQAEPAEGLPGSMLLVRVFGDGIEVDEHYSQDKTAALVKHLRGLGVQGRIVFRTPCG